MAVLTEVKSISKEPKRGIYSDATTKEFVRSNLAVNLLKESKGQYTDMIKVNWNDKVNELTVEPPDKNWKLYKDVYERVGIIKNCIDNTADFALQNGYELEGGSKETIQKFIDKTNFDLILHNILKQCQIYGNAFVEMSKNNLGGWELKILPVDQMRVVVYKGGNNDGEIKGYKQTTITNSVIEFDKDEVIQFKWNTATSTFYGISDIKAVNHSLTSLLNFQEDIGEIIHRYASPLLHHKLGTEESPAGAADITDYKSLLDNRKIGEDLITSSNVEITAIVNNLKMIQPDGMIKNLENQLIGGLRVPEIFIRGGETSNKATADVELQAFDRKVKALRKAISIQVEDNIFTKVTNGVTMSWNELSVEGENTKAQTFLWLTQGGIPAKVAMQMCGWKSWVDNFDAEVKKNPPITPAGATSLPPNQKPMTPNEKPREEDFDTQAEWFEAEKQWEKQNNLKGTL